jgi:multiple sugar transport system permease protein
MDAGDAGDGRTMRVSRQAWVILGSFAKYAVLVAMALSMIVPLLWMVTTSFKQTQEIFSFPPEFIPRSVTFFNYANLLKVVPFTRWYLNSAIVAISVTLLAAFFSSLSGYVFGRLDFPGKTVLFYLVLATLMVPGQVILVPVYILMVRLGMVNSYQGLIIPHIATAFGTATIDGCSEFGIFWRVILPLAKPGVAALMIIVFMNTWNDLLWPLILTTSMQMQTLPVGLALFTGQTTTPWGLVMAGASLAVIPTILVFALFQRQFVEGMARTGLKG